MTLVLQYLLTDFLRMFAVGVNICRVSARLAISSIMSLLLKNNKEEFNKAAFISVFYHQYRGIYVQRS